MKLEILSFIACIAILIEICSGAKLDPSVGSNWNVPTSTVAPQPQQYYYRTIPSESQSSFVPTTALNSANLKVSKGNYYQVGKDYQQYYQYQPETNSYEYPVSGSAAEQRQEFLDPNLNGMGPFQGGFDGDGGDGGGGGFFGGIRGTANNIAEAFGLSGLGVLGGFLVFLVGGPLLIFALLVPVAILFVAMMGFPVLQLTLPPTDPNLGRKFKAGFIESARKAKEVLQSEECVERLSCGLARKARKLPYESWILQKMDNTTNVWANRVSKSIKTGRAGQDCNQFKCVVAVKIKEVYDMFKRK